MTWRYDRIGNCQAEKQDSRKKDFEIKHGATVTVTVSTNVIWTKTEQCYGKIQPSNQKTNIILYTKNYTVLLRIVRINSNLIITNSNLNTDQQRTFSPWARPKMVLTTMWPHLAWPTGLNPASPSLQSIRRTMAKMVMAHAEKRHLCYVTRVRVNSSQP